MFAIYVTKIAILNMQKSSKNREKIEFNNRIMERGYE